MRAAVILSGMLFVATPAWAHVGVTPRESKTGATETYTFRVPSEGGKTTVAVTLEVPADVTIASVSAAEGSRHAERRVGDRIVEITWTIDIKPGASAQLSFVAKNPVAGTSISWKVHQKYSDSTSSDWVGDAGSRAPAPVTTLTTP